MHKYSCEKLFPTNFEFITSRDGRHVIYPHPHTVYECTLMILWPDGVIQSACGLFFFLVSI